MWFGATQSAAGFFSWHVEILASISSEEEINGAHNVTAPLLVNTVFFCFSYYIIVVKKHHD